MTTRASRSTWIFLTAATALALMATAIAAPRAEAEQPPVGLGGATPFAVLGGSTVTNTGDSVLNGDLGVSPGTAITGFGPGTVNGETHTGDDPVAIQAQSDLGLAYDDAAGRGPATAVATELGGRTLGPGVYENTTLGITGTLTLDAGGEPDAVFVFQSGSTLITAESSAVELIGDADPCNVFWQITSTATLGTDSQFVGSILAMEAITATTGATVEGRLLVRDLGAVTLDTNLITEPDCATLPPGPPPPPPPTTTVPDDSTTTVPDDSTTTAPGETTTTVPDDSTTTVPAGPGPGEPDGPGAPGEPDGPGAPGEPDGPGAPGEPDGPGAPGEPDGPGAPGEPDAPAAPPLTDGLDGPSAPGAGSDTVTSELPRTGSQLGRVAQIGAVIVLFGGLVFFARRRVAAGSA
jgi:type VI secretion system secreted protein VgrG